ncbi:SMC-Scp complex subunit ScpB [Microbulbifer sp. OS29]|uniref:SMC-Scp complex subunit ScpB n=1 Tax=Microbulbifer okhotskensis TaxID=2926617 RepID=A0A9X2J5C0_9GAMM|nr:SMC-Scp complex subunit ScpB [Microbulbifer okhotskensis]MCO1335053.1 SMC-Scp complex subunit ScpB [Microbulbifer okhotskensis]
MTIAPELLRKIVEGALLAAGQPLSEDKLLSLLDEAEQPTKTTLRDVLEEIAQNCAGRGFELKKVASGWRFQVPEDLAPWVNRLWEEKAQRYSRATLETLAIIAYRQPVTRGDIEEIRGVAVSSQIVRTLLERGWIKVVGQRDVPGKPSLYATTREFLDYFNLSTLDGLPTLAEIRDIESFNQILEQEGLPAEQAAPSVGAPDAEADSRGQAAPDLASETEASPAESLSESDDEVDDALVASLADVIEAEAVASDLPEGDPLELSEEVVADIGIGTETEAGELAEEEDPVEVAVTQVERQLAESDSAELVEPNAGTDYSGESEIESSAESLQVEEESEASLAATLPPSSMFAEGDTVDNSAEEPAAGSTDVDEDSKEVVQVENTTL